jgi:UDP-N-acetylglucosamine--dolichyl-phosphate N-acetylglucosaminephosphotransferase
MNKYQHNDVAELGGITVLLGFFLGVLLYIALRTFYFNDTNQFIEIFALLSVVLLVAAIGFVDDVLGWKIGLNKQTRIILLIFASIPLIVINAGHSSVYLPFVGLVNLGLIYPLIIIPLGVVGASATFNFLAGYNGLEAGQGIIMLSALSLVSYFTGKAWLSLILLLMVASLAAFYFFNKYPASIFPGDSLTYPIGAMIAIAAILGDMERIALFFFIPYFIEICLKLRGGLKKESFGTPNKDGTLDLKYEKFYGVEHIAIYTLKKIRGKATEIEIVYLINLFQIVIVLLGIIIFREVIFT